MLESEESRITLYLEQEVTLYLNKLAFSSSKDALLYKAILKLSQFVEEDDSMKCLKTDI